MPSRSLLQWRNKRLPSLLPIEAAHAAIVGDGRGRRYVTQQINQAFAMILSSQFQGFCRDLHSECVDGFVTAIAPAAVQNVLRIEFLLGRKLETGNPNPGHLGSDFNRFGFKLFEALMVLDSDTTDRKLKLEELNIWRNAIGHQDFTHKDLKGKSTISLARVQGWRKACEGLANSMDEVMRLQLLSILGTSPW
jgi:hypothetical protein